MRSSLHIDCIAHGVRMRVHADAPELLARVQALLPYGTEIVANPNFAASSFSLRRSPDGDRFTCWAGSQMIIESQDMSAACDALAQALMVHVANYAEDYVFVHAGVVAYKGVALILPGVSFAGKSTLTAALVRAGATYYSDEYALFDAEGYVHPYARDLSMRQPGETLQQSLPVSRLGGSAGVGPVPVARVLFTQYRKAAQWSPQAITPGMAILDLMQHSIPVQRSPQKVMSTLAAAFQTANAWTSVRDDAERLAPVLLDWMTHTSNRREPEVAERDAA